MCLCWLYLVVLVGIIFFLVFDGCLDDDDFGQVIFIDGKVFDYGNDLGMDGKIILFLKMCMVNVDCVDLDGVDVCCQGICDLVMGTCFFWVKFNCCVDDIECNDDDSNILDICDVDLGVCKYEDLGTMCQIDSDCVVEKDCIVFECKEYCVYW